MVKSAWNSQQFWSFLEQKMWIPEFLSIVFDTTKKWKLSIFLTIFRIPIFQRQNSSLVITFCGLWIMCSKCSILGIGRKMELQLTLFPSPPSPPSFNVATLWRYAEHICKSQHCIGEWGSHFPLKTLEFFKTFFEDCRIAQCYNIYSSTKPYFNKPNRNCKIYNALWEILSLFRNLTFDISRLGS